MADIPDSERGLPPKDRTIDPREAAQIEAERLKALAPSTYRHPDGSPPVRQDFEAFSRQYDQMSNERHVWRFARPDGSTYETSWKGLGTRTTAQAQADLLGHQVVGEVIPRSAAEVGPAQVPDTRRSEPQLTPPPLVQAEPPLTQPPLVQAEPPFEPLPRPNSQRINNDERAIAPNTRALNRSAGKKSVERPGSPLVNKPAPIQKPSPSPPARIDPEIEKRVREYRDRDAPPRLAAEKLKPVHNITTEHQEKVRDVVNWAIQSATLEAKPGTGAHLILAAAQDKIARLRTSNIPDAPNNLIYRDADHYLAARTQEFKARAAFMLYDALNKLNPGSMTAEQAMRIANAPWSSETNKWAVGPLGANQLYENKKLQQFASEAKGGPAGEQASAAGGTEWELLGLIDFERYDANAQQAAPHVLVDLPGKGDRFGKSSEVPAYLREEAVRIVEKMDRDAKFTK